MLQCERKWVGEDVVLVNLGLKSLDTFGSKIINVSAALQRILSPIGFHFGLT